MSSPHAHDWTSVARRVREVIAALHRLRSGIEATDVGWAAARLDPVIRAAESARDQLAELGADPGAFQPVIPPPLTGFEVITFTWAAAGPSQRRDGLTITGDVWRQLALTAEVAHVALQDLAQDFRMFPGMNACWMQAASSLTRAWATLDQIIDHPRDEPSRVRGSRSKQRYRRCFRERPRITSEPSSADPV